MREHAAFQQYFHLFISAWKLDCNNGPVYCSPVVDSPVFADTTMESHVFDEAHDLDHGIVSENGPFGNVSLTMDMFLMMALSLITLSCDGPVYHGVIFDGRPVFRDLGRPVSRDSLEVTIDYLVLINQHLVLTRDFCLVTIDYLVLINHYLVVISDYSVVKIDYLVLTIDYFDDGHLVGGGPVSDVD